MNFRGKYHKIKCLKDKVCIVGDIGAPLPFLCRIRLHSSRCWQRPVLSGRMHAWLGHHDWSVEKRHPPNLISWYLWNRTLSRIMYITKCFVLMIDGHFEHKRFWRSNFKFPNNHTAKLLLVPKYSVLVFSALYTIKDSLIAIKILILLTPFVIRSVSKKSES
jgi:hypothetical protein